MPALAVRTDVLDDVLMLRQLLRDLNLPLYLADRKFTSTQHLLARQDLTVAQHFVNEAVAAHPKTASESKGSDSPKVKSTCPAS